MNTPQKLVFDLLDNDVKCEYKEYISCMRGIQLRKLYINMRASYTFCSKLNNITNDMKICYSESMIKQINTGVFDEDALLIEKCMKEIRENIPLILLPEREIVDKQEKFICSCNARIRNATSNINAHLLGNAHRKYIEKQKLM
jgi:hypothetical protein